jgi:arylsulfatase A-like enzyme
MEAKNKYLVPSLVLPLVCSGLTLAASNQKKESQKPNVIFIIIDDLNNYEGAFGGHKQAKTPNIDRLAKSGVSFMQGYTNCPVSQPSRNSLFTGVYPHKSKDFGWIPLEKQPITGNCKTFVDLFKENGYLTMGSGKLLHTEKFSSWDQFENKKLNNYGPFAYNGVKGVGHSSVPLPFRDIGPVDGSWGAIEDVPVYIDSITGERKGGWTHNAWGKFQPFRVINEHDRDMLPDEIHAEWAVKKIQEMEKSNSTQPFLMGVGFVRPHTPLTCPQRFFDMFPLDQIELNPIQPNDKIDTYYEGLNPAESKGLLYFNEMKKSYNGKTEEGLKVFLQAYLACIAFMDEQVGKVIDALDNSKFKNNTIVVFVADNGWQMGSKDYLFKNSPWEESTQIPYIVRAPGAKNGSKVYQPVSLIDIYPTLTDLCGVKGDTKLNEKGVNIDGYSLKPLLTDPDTKKWKGPKGAISMIGDLLLFDKELNDVMDQTYTYRTKDWRYILYRDGSEELYHNATDPREWKNLASDNQYLAKKQEMKKEMLKLIQTNK